MFDSYAISLERTVKDVVRHPESELMQRLIPGEPEVSDKMHFKLTLLTPRHEQTLYRFRSAIRLSGKDIGSWEETYLYREGHFVLIGFGGWPLWSWQEGSEPHAFTNGHFVIQPVLVQRVPPKYPSDAKKQNVEGTVLLRIRVGKDGAVGKIDVVNGDPQLAPAAIEAVQQWRYQPGTIGGSPFEAEVTVSVVFSLHGG
jgi:TonB family protein